MRKKIFLQQQQVEKTLLEAREVNRMTGHFLCSLLSFQPGHDQQNVVYSLALSYFEMEKNISNSLEAHFSAKPFNKQHNQQPPKKYSITVTELDLKLKQLLESLSDNKTQKPLIICL